MSATDHHGIDYHRHRRSTVAWSRVRAWPSKQADRTRLMAKVKGLPTLIRQMGLAPAVAFLDSRTETARLADDLAHWFLVEHPAKPLGDPSGGGRRSKQLVKGYVKLDASLARSLDEEAIIFAELLKLYSEVA